MEQQTNKAHRPSHSGAKAEKKKLKGKERQHGFNEKVRAEASILCLLLTVSAHGRLSHQNLAEKLRSRVDELRSATKHDCTCLWSIVHQMMSLRP